MIVERTSLLSGVAVVVGAASGIGRTTAITLARHGVEKLAVADLNRKGLEETKELILQIRKLPIQILELNIAQEADVIDAFASIVSEFGEINILVNTAGIPGPIAPSTEVSKADFQRVLEVNTTGIWLVQRESIKHMLKQKPRDRGNDKDFRGAIVNISSIYGFLGTHQDTSAAAYTASKHAVLGLTKTDSNRYARDGIRINAVCAGFVNTALMRANTGARVKAEMEKVPMGRFAEAEEIAETVSFLCSPMSSYMTGVGLVVDGGFINL